MKRTARKPNSKRILAAVAFAAVFAVLFLLIQRLFTPSFNWPEFYENTSLSLEDFQDLPKDEVDVVFLGTSHMAYAASPMELYRSKRITSYNLCTSVQPADGTVFLLKQALKTQHPKAVVVDVSGFFFGIDTAKDLDKGYHYILDAFPLSADKIELAKRYQAFYERANDLEPGIKTLFAKDSVFWPSLIPFIKYHDRWSELNEADFRDYAGQTSYYSAGQIMSSVIVKGTKTVDAMNEEARAMADAGLYDPVIPEENIACLKEIKELCEAADCALVFTKAPSVVSPSAYTSAWTKIRSDYTKQVMEELDLEFVDILYDEDLGFDWAVDTPDGGQHLNYNGAKKVTAFLGNYLKKNVGLKKHRSDVFEEKMLTYDKVTALMSLQMETSLYKYLTKLDQVKEKYRIVICVKGDMIENLQDYEKRALWRLGLKKEFTEDMRQHSYAAVINGGVRMLDKESAGEIDYVYEFQDGLSLEIVSRGTLAGNRARMFFNGTNYSVNTRGINIALYDLETRQIVDVAGFDTALKKHPAKRTDDTIEKLFREYETYQTFGFERKS